MAGPDLRPSGAAAPDAPRPQHVQRVFLVLTLLNTLASSLIWGINTLFLLEAGLSSTAAFAANAFFSAGQVLFEVPTGVVADTWGRRASYLLGTLTLVVSTALYWLAWRVQAPFWAWAVSSVLIGLGFTFFSGATEAWLVDALRFARYGGDLESVFSKAQVVGGAATLSGSVAGGLIAQWTDLGVPYLLRSLALVISFAVAFVFMRDWGFTPQGRGQPAEEVRHVLRSALRHGFGNPPVRWVMLSSVFTVGVGFYAFYAAQPYLLALYGDERAYGVAGLAAAIVAGAQIAGGAAAPWIRGRFRRRTSALLAALLAACVLLGALGLATRFPVAIVLLILWALVSAAATPIRQAYLNGRIPSEQRATVLSFDNLLGSAGGVVVQPTLGRVADIWGYPASFLAGGALQLLAAPFLALARATRSDEPEGAAPPEDAPAAAG